MSVTWRTRLYAVLLALIAIGTIHYQTASAPDWGFDGYTYAIRMQMDAGASYVRARTKAQLFYADKAVVADPTIRHYLYTPYPQYWALFAPRIIYPWIASWLWPVFGMQSLLIVSNVAFVTAIVLLYALLLRYTVAGIAFALSLSCCALPDVRLYGSGASTDMLAFAFFVAALYAIVRYVSTESRGWFSAYAVGATLMTLTRPIPYIFVIAGLSLAISGLRTGNRRHVRLGIRIGVPTLLLCVVVVAMGAFAHSPSFVAIITQLRVGSNHLMTAPLWLWYAARVVDVTLRSVAATFALFAAPVALVALWIYRERADIMVFLGIVTASFATVLVDPIVGDIWRVVIFPLLPVFCCGLALSANAVLRIFISRNSS